MNCKLIYFPDCEGPALRLAQHAGLDSARIEVHHFPDGESLVTLPQLDAENVCIYRSLNQPNEKLVELLLAARGCREVGARRLVLVAPYLAYMRQDKAFKKGQVVSQRVIGHFLSGLFDGVATVDAHLHRVRNINEVLPGCKGVNLKTAELTASYIKKNYSEPPYILGPDEESLQWVKSIAQVGGFEYGVCEKVRFGDANVHVELPRLAFKNRQIILVDDIVSTGHTLSSAAKGLVERGVRDIHCIVTHALFVRGASSLLRKSGIKRIISTDTVPHSSNRIFIAPVVAKALSDLI